MDVGADADRGDHVVGALQDERPNRHAREVGAVVGQERHAREVRRDLRVGRTEGVGQLVAELGPVLVAHDHRRHRARPAEVVAGQRLQQPVDVLAREAALVPVVVDVARRRADHDQPREALRLGDGGQRADHRADRVADEDRTVDVQRTQDRQDVLGVAVQRPVALGIEGRVVGMAVADVVEQDHAVLVGKRRPDEAPHVLITAEAVGEDDRRTVGPAVDGDVVAAERVHARPILRRGRDTTELVE